jgi:hypothetical protein
VIGVAVAGGCVVLIAIAAVAFVVVRRRNAESDSRAPLAEDVE